MATYTATADANGDFTVHFSSNYTAGQKITVTAEKEGATKSIELHAPSDTTGGGVIRFSGSLSSFPANVGVVTLTEGISGTINQGAFEDSGSYYSIWGKATGLVILGAVMTISTDAFKYWGNATSLTLPSTLTTIQTRAFKGWGRLTELVIPDSVTTVGSEAFYSTPLCTKLTIGSGVTSIGTQAFGYFVACNEITLKPTTPPHISSNTFQNLKAGCVFKVPSASLAAYQAAANWSAFASQMVGV